MKHIILLVLIVLTACTPRATQEISQPNSEITLEELPGWKDVYDAMGAIDLVLRNHSDSRVSFASNFGADIYIKNGTKWEKLNNNYGYSTYGQVLPTASEYPAGLIVPVAPDLDQITIRPIVLRINVNGTLSDSGKDVEAYLDITIEQFITFGDLPLRYRDASKSNIVERKRVFQYSPNTACTRLVGLVAFSSCLHGLKLVPSKWRCLVPPTSG